LAIANAKGGIVLIDEVENGFHHQILADVWRSIADAARNFDVQVFATTHSWECVVSANEAFSSAIPYDFALHRVERVHGKTECVTYDREAFEGALKAGLEVR
jgi:predicted ATPase